MAASNPFKIVITAVDKATATVNKINRSFDRLTRPVSPFNQSVKTLGRAAGFDRLGNALRGAAKVAGLSTQALDGGLKSLGESLEDALYGRNSQALVALNRLGIGIHKTAAGAIVTSAIKLVFRTLCEVHGAHRRPDR